MAKVHPTRLVIFASGSVGAAILGQARDRFPDNLAGIVTAIGDKEILSACSPIPRSTPHLVWDQSSREACERAVEAMRPDIIFLAWWPHLLSPAALRLGQAYTLNTHPSLLPHCRGKDPNFWAIVEDRPFGVTIHHVDEGVDSGDIAFQRKLEVNWEDSGETLYRRAQDAIISLFRDVCPDIIDLAIPRQHQNHAEGSVHRRQQLDGASLIDLDRSYTGRDLLNLLRARHFPPHPGAHFEDAGYIYDVRISIQKRRSHLGPS